MESITIANGYAPLISMDDAWGGAIFCDNGASPMIVDCVLLNNTAMGWPSNGYGGGVASRGDARPTLIGCRLIQNEATFGGGIYGDFATVEGCQFLDNTAGIGAGARLRTAGPGVVSGCTYARNSASYRGGGLYCSGGTWVIVGSTFCQNSAGNSGGGIACREGLLDVSNTIVAFSSEGEAVFLDGGASAVLTCCDLYGNAGGDWTGSIADQLGVNGNISEDPLFCDLPALDLTLHSDSPCAPEYNPECGLIGAWPVGCGPSSTVPCTWGALKSLFRR